MREMQYVYSEDSASSRRWIRIRVSIWFFYVGLIYNIATLETLSSTFFHMQSSYILIVTSDYQIFFTQLNVKLWEIRCGQPNAFGRECVHTTRIYGIRDRHLGDAR